MRIVKIPKGGGKFRTIYVPNREERAALRLVAGEVLTAQRKLCDRTVVHGFVHGRSAVTNATAHIGHAYTLCFDLKDFFDSVTRPMLEGKLSKEVLDVVLVDGAPRQGLPTSPAVANIAAVAMDKAILKWAAKAEKQVIYTRYADDLTFSFDDPALRTILPVKVKEIVGMCGFRLAEQKTRLYMASGGRRMVTGVAVGDADVAPTREVKRRLRAAQHQAGTHAAAATVLRASLGPISESTVAGHNRVADLEAAAKAAAFSARGLEEWAKCRLPRVRSCVGGKGSDLEKLCKHWKLSGKIATDTVEKPTEQLTENVWVSGDPIYMIGMSTWTPGWTSCMSQPRGAYRKGVATWTLSEHTRIAVLLDTKEKTICGVTRRNMLARALVHELTSGQKVYGVLYPRGDAHTAELEKTLQGAGYVSFATVRELLKKDPKKGATLKGDTPWVCGGPYIDGGTFQKPPQRDKRKGVTYAVLKV